MSGGNATAPRRHLSRYIHTRGFARLAGAFPERDRFVKAERQRFFVIFAILLFAVGCYGVFF